VGLLFLVKNVLQYELYFEPSVVPPCAYDARNFVIHVFFVARFVAIFRFDVTYEFVGLEGLEHRSYGIMQCLAVLADNGAPDGVLEVFGPVHWLVAVIIQNFL